MNGRVAWYKKYIDNSFIKGMAFQTNPTTGEIWFESDISESKGGLADWVASDRLIFKDPEEGSKNE